MKIIYYYSGYSSNMSGWQKVNFIDELSNNGHEIILVSMNDYVDAQIKNDKIRADITLYQPDLFMTSCDDSTLTSDFLSVIKQASIPSLLICFDNLSVPFKHRKCCSMFDLVWLTSVETQHIFRAWGAKTIFLPYASNPNVYKPTDGDELPTVSFVGTCYGVRKRKIESLLDHNIPVKLFGGNNTSSEQHTPARNVIKNLSESTLMVANLMRFDIGRKSLIGAIKKSFIQKDSHGNVKFNELQSERKSLSFENMIDVYSRSAISLGVTELWNTYLLKEPIHKIHLRCFEIPMSGGIQLVTKTDEIASYFMEDSEAIYYGCEDEMIDKCKFYLQDDKSTIREKIKENARKRSLASHTWMHRFNNVFSELKLK
ncbi:MAG: spore maturation protein CgeB [Colwellia sp.]|jgi:spore maturation protein CgeB